MPNRKQITLRTLADHLGLTVHTVSKALRGLPGMSEQTRKEVIDLAMKLGYRTKNQEQGMAVEHIPIYSSKSRRFAFIVPNTGMVYIHQSLYEGIQSRLAEFGHKLEMLFAPSDAVSDEAFNEWADKYSLLFTDGLFLTPMITAKTEEKLLSLPLPKVLLNYPPPAAQVDSVMWDVSSAVHQSVQYLLSRGHRRILYIGDIHLHRGFRLRWQAFREAMATAGLTVDEEHHLTDTGSPDTYTLKLTRMLERIKPTAIIAGIDHDLSWVYYGCSLIGRKIPVDYSIVGLEHSPNIRISDLTRPILPIKEVGFRGADRMLWRLANPNLPFEHIRLQGGFYDGATVLPL
ncbi:LacI family DNA-binding transcriptional regulator [Paenibacillus glycanilyticus]|uniref:LacI family transcriptional regulator n=1 Tax=Paenibacillus glycanilyticus TaxID=126569 RepID=A0ABQ6GNF9_9BACL|nr:LacI family DNA-binding transcriptional regulator [Paenibacillus glycanilyticus]GLX70983.1 LacI family transcriptional regulator [Paenibacillus glycanilyticus]